MTTKIFFLFLFELFIPLYALPIVIIVHGGFNGGQSEWHKPDGDFFQVLKKEAEKLGHELTTFRWSQPIGGILDAELMYGGYQLAQTINEYRKKDRITNQYFDNNKIILIGHSYGGIVSYYASDFLNNNKRLTPFPLIEGKQMFVQPSLLQPTLKRCSTFLGQAQHFIFGRKKKKFSIDALYVLGTPHGSHAINPDMTVIDKVYNIYSTGDFIGTKLIGSWTPPHYFTQHPRIANIQITYFKDDSFINPNHEMLRYPIMAEWILQVPTIFKKSFSFSKTGNITLYHNHLKEPTYKTL